MHASGALIEPLSCILHGWDRIVKASGGSLDSDTRVLIIGAGIIGNLFTCLCHHFGLVDVTISEPGASRRTLSQNMGTHIINGTCTCRIQIDKTLRFQDLDMMSPLQMI